MKRRRRGWAFRKVNHLWLFGITLTDIYSWDERSGKVFTLGFGPFHLSYHTQEKEK